MKKTLHLLGLFIFLISCSPAEPVSGEDFTREFASHLRQEYPESQVVIGPRLEINVVRPSGFKNRLFLDNAYRKYCLNPQAKSEIMAEHSNLLRDDETQEDSPLDPANILPTIRAREWVDGTRETFKNDPSSKKFDLIVESLNDELVLVYAIDHPKFIQFAKEGDLKEAGVKLSDLKGLARSNFEKKFPEIQCEEHHGIYFFGVGEGYESGILFSEKIWKNLKFDGEIVVALPSKDILMATGSKNDKSIEIMRAAAKKSYAEEAYPLTDKLFLFRAGTLVELK